ncbi:hypothetical protein MLD38_014460 [Melastoma candidum]|uniref:Uncharacterized protein n=1 Tax=Melastoma candidum TaxID=119954 RepID=A0ACB9RE11_9MYRT|nr:hypothetical protein MLD38_014460 [Melastoma candidum]
MWLRKRGLGTKHLEYFHLGLNGSQQTLWNYCFELSFVLIDSPSGAWTTHHHRERSQMCFLCRTETKISRMEYCLHDLWIYIPTLRRHYTAGEHKKIIQKSCHGHSDESTYESPFHVHPFIVGTPYRLGQLVMAGVMCWIAIRNIGAGCNSSGFSC